MHVTNSRAYRLSTGHRVVEFLSRGGDTVFVQFIEENLVDEADVVDQTWCTIVELNVFSTKCGSQSANAYETLSNGNFDEEAASDTLR